MTAGRLRVVATPLGNLADLSPRAREALETADAIACEDTRRTGRLLELLGLPRKPLLSYFAPQEKRKTSAILARLEAGETIALVTDGGTPGVSDPGATLVGAAHAAGVVVEAVPGPSAVTLALSVSSLAGERFVFEGFVPPKREARRKRLAELAGDPRTLVFYEGPHRIAAFLADAAAILGERRRGTIVREGTKRHEEVCEGTLAELASRFPGRARGEFVVVVEGGAPDPDVVTVGVRDLLAFAAEHGLSPARAAKEIARLTGVSRNRLQRLASEAPAP